MPPTNKNPNSRRNFQEFNPDDSKHDKSRDELRQANKEALEELDYVLDGFRDSKRDLQEPEVLMRLDTMFHGYLLKSGSMFYLAVHCGRYSTAVLKIIWPKTLPRIVEQLRQGGLKGKSIRVKQIAITDDSGIDMYNEKWKVDWIGGVLERTHLFGHEVEYGDLDIEF